MNSKLNELRKFIRNEIKAAIQEASKTDDLKAQISTTEKDIDAKSKTEKAKLSKLYTQLGQELGKEK